jgi:hypothetical protein
VFRKLLVYLFIVTSLSAQAKVAFACDMMGQVVDDCCCGEMQAPWSPDESVGAADACCTPVTLIDTDHAGSSDTAKTAFKALNPDLQPQPVAVVASTAALPVSRKVAAVQVPPEPIARPGTLTYLNTLRLRI